MNDETLFDRLRALAEGRLCPAEVERLHAEAAGDPELARLIESYALVHGVTGLGAGQTPTTTVLFEHLRVGQVRRPWFAMRFVAAAAVLAAAAFAGRQFLRSSEPAPLVLDAISLAAAQVPVVEELPDEVLKAVAQFSAVEDGEIAWGESLAEARQVARVAGRPVLHFIHHPTCPWCTEMRRDTFNDEAVTALVTRFVPVHEDVTEMPGDKGMEIFQAGWPYLAVESPSGEVIHAFHGRHDAEDFRGHLETAIEKSGDQSPQPWDRVRALANTLLRARAAEGRGDLRDALAGYREVETSDPAGWLGRAGAAGSGRIADSAREALLRARDVAQTDREQAATSLADAARRFAATPQGADLERVLARLRADGAFPPLQESIR